MRKLLIAIALALGGGALWWRRNPSAMPYWQRFFVELPHVGITRERLLEILEPGPRERLLEVGPGTGYYALTVARRLEKGRLEVYDLEPRMVEHVMERAKREGVANVTGWNGDARDMLFENDRFDGAYLTMVLGEIPDQDAALSELRRVLKPSGRLVVGETFVGDPHVVMFDGLRRRAEEAGLRFEQRFGSPLGYFALFRK